MALFWSFSLDKERKAISKINNNLPLYSPSGDTVRTGRTSPSDGRGTAANNNLPHYCPSGDSVHIGCTSPSDEGGAAVNNHLLAQCFGQIFQIGFHDVDIGQPRGQFFLGNHLVGVEQENFCARLLGNRFGHLAVRTVDDKDVGEM